MRIGFIGGSGHHNIGPIVREAVDGTLPEIAVAGDGRDDAAAQRFHAGLGRGAWFEDARHLLDSFKPDLVSVGSVYGYAGDWIAEAIARDIPVTSDKPIAASWEQLNRLRELVRENPRRVILSEFAYRSHPAFRAARDAVARGLIGRVVLATGQKSYRFGANLSAKPGEPGARPPWYADRRAYGGTILWVASHAIDALRFTSGLRFVSVSGRQGNLSKPDYGSMEDHTVSLFELEGGATALVHADYLRPAKAPTHGDDRIRLAGSLGILEIRADRCRLITHDAGDLDITGQTLTAPVHRELLSAIRGESTDLYSTAASLEMAAVLLHARDAADRGGVVPIAYEQR